MHTGLIISGHVAARAITAACRNAGHQVNAINIRQIDAAACQNFQAVIVCTLPNTGILDALMTSIPDTCQLIYISSWKIFPSRPQAVPWTEECFNTGEAVFQGESMANADREAEYLLQVGGRSIYWTILRTAIVEGPTDANPLHTRWFVERILTEGPICLPDDDEQPYRHVSTHDLALAVVTVMGQTRAHQRVLHVCADTVLLPSLHARFVARALNRQPDLHYVSTESWEQAGLPRPMAGRNGAALIAPSPLLYELGWRARPSELFLKNLAREFAAQPRRLDDHARARELALLRPSCMVVTTHSPMESGWMLEASSTAGPAIDVVHLENPSSGPWQTVAVGVGEDMERTLTTVGATGIKLQPTMPLLAECSKNGGIQTVLACTRSPRDRIVEGDDLVPVPSELGLLGLLAVPLARLLAVWPVNAQEGDVWILGRGIEALLAYWLATEQQRVAKIWSFKCEVFSTIQEEIKIESIQKISNDSPAIAVNVSGVSESEVPLANRMPSKSILITPFMPLTPLRNQAHLKKISNIPPQHFLTAALNMLLKWRNRLLNRNVLTCIPIQSTHRVFCVPALCMPILVVKDPE